MVTGKESLVWKLKKSLYGLKQSPRIWYHKFDTFVLSLGFVRSNSDHCVYYKNENAIYLSLLSMWMTCCSLGMITVWLLT